MSFEPVRVGSNSTCRRRPEKIVFGGNARIRRFPADIPRSGMRRYEHRALILEGCLQFAYLNQQPPVSESLEYPTLGKSAGRRESIRFTFWSLRP